MGSRCKAELCDWGYPWRRTLPSLAVYKGEVDVCVTVTIIHSFATRLAFMSRFELLCDAHASSRA